MKANCKVALLLATLGGAPVAVTADPKDFLTRSWNFFWQEVEDDSDDEMAGYGEEQQELRGVGVCDGCGPWVTDCCRMLFDSGAFCYNAVAHCCGCGQAEENNRKDE